MNKVEDRIVQYPNRYQLKNVDTGEILGTFDFVAMTGSVQAQGTPINKSLFDSISKDIEFCKVSAVSEAGNNTAFMLLNAKSELREEISLKESKVNLGALAYKDFLTKEDVGLGNVNNTPNAEMNVNHANTAGHANTADMAEEANNANNAKISELANNASKLDGKTISELFPSKEDWILETNGLYKRLTLEAQSNNNTFIPVYIPFAGQSGIPHKVWISRYLNMNSAEFEDSTHESKRASLMLEFEGFDTSWNGMPSMIRTSYAGQGYATSCLKATEVVTNDNYGGIVVWLRTGTKPTDYSIWSEYPLTKSGKQIQAFYSEKEIGSISVAPIILENIGDATNTELYNRGIIKVSYYPPDIEFIGYSSVADKALVADKLSTEGLMFVKRIEVPRNELDSKDGRQTDGPRSFSVGIKKEYFNTLKFVDGPIWFEIPFHFERLDDAGAGIKFSFKVIVQGEVKEGEIENLQLLTGARYNQIKCEIEEVNDTIIEALHYGTRAMYIAFYGINVDLDVLGTFYDDGPLTITQLVTL